MDRIMGITQEALGYGVKCGGCGQWVTDCKCPDETAFNAMVEMSKAELDEVERAVKFAQGRKPHYIAMGGVHGCLPTHCETYDTWQDAVTAVVNQYELGKKRAGVLVRYGHLELNSKHDGNEYVEIVECTCSKPEEH